MKLVLLAICALIGFIELTCCQESSSIKEVTGEALEDREDVGRQTFHVR